MKSFELSEIKYKYPVNNRFALDVEAFHQKERVGVAIARLYVEENGYRSVDLARFQVLPELNGIVYHRKGIARTMFNDHILPWARGKKADVITGYIMSLLLVEDSSEHVAQYLRKLGFSINNNDFRMDLK